MYQQFFKDTLISRYVKNLLRSTALPIYKAVEDGDFLVQGHLYVYKEFIIECFRSGKLIISSKEKLYPSNNLYPSLKLFPNLPAMLVFNGVDKEKALTSISNYIAEFKVIDYYNEDIYTMNYNYHSKYMYYDSDTHKQLGEYLRSIKVMKKLNLMHYYNCFSNKSMIGFYLDNKADHNYIIGNTSRYKQLAIPVKFGKTYTIALESYTPIQLRSVIYTDSTGMVTQYNSNSNEPPVYYSDWINDYEEYLNVDFSKPFTKTIYPTNSSELYSQEKNLYLIIQVDKSNDSELVVLEGDYVTSNNGCKNPELLAYNYHATYAFSDRLIEYLLDGVITQLDPLDGNVYQAQTWINETMNALDISNNKKSNITGVWSESVNEDIRVIEDKMLEQQQYFDLDGNINVDVEKFMLRNRKEV